jgi:threonine aldolase
MNSSRTGGIVDMRGDWAAPPTDAMRRAMADAEVGDDNSREDPTVRRLEEMAAGRFARDAALFVPSGTMGNLVSILAQAAHGDEIIVGESSHTFVYEVGGAAAIGGQAYRTLPNDRFGMLDPEHIVAAIRPQNIHFPRTGLIAFENTHNLRGGTVLTREQSRAIIDVGARHSIPVHLDGSRIFHAAAVLGCSVADLTAGASTVQFCLSKGLAAPVGSMVVGPTATIEIARYKRKLLGGGMRQAGVIAAAGIIALDQMVERLPDDHATARRLAMGLAGIPGLHVDLDVVQTNIVFATTTGSVNAPTLNDALNREGIRGNVFSRDRIRFATHYCVDTSDIDRTLHLVQRVMTGTA